MQLIPVASQFASCNSRPAPGANPSHLGGWARLNRRIDTWRWRVRTKQHATQCSFRSILASECLVLASRQNAISCHPITIPSSPRSVQAPK